MEKKDALFFYQLLLPICDPEQSGIVDDPRVGFYVPVSTHSNKDASVDKKLDGNCKHRWQTLPSFLNSMGLFLETVQSRTSMTVGVMTKTNTTV